jgi:predicted outer membrane protein
MQRKTLLVSAASLFLAGSAALAIAQDAAPKASATPAAKTAQQSPQRDGGPKWGHGGPRGGDHGHGGWGHGRGHEMNPVIGDLRSLERLYVMTGRQKELPALYNDVLAKSQNPMVRDYAYRHLARAQMAPTNVDAAIATMKKSLDENLANDQKRHQEMEQFKARMQQRMEAKSTDSK